MGGGNGGVKRKVTRFWGKKNETKILYLIRVNVTEPKEVLNLNLRQQVQYRID